jgi:hypothetical protein
MVDGGFRETFWPLRTWLDQSLSRETYELIWVDYTDRVAEQVMQHHRIRTFALGRDDEPQVLAYAFNEGICRARGEIVVLPDADVCCEWNLLEVIASELTADAELVLYVLRLDQPRNYYLPEQGLEHVRKTCSVKHTYNYGGCTAIGRRWLVEMNGYEQLPIFSGYHYNGGDNYIRFKNMGLKIRWHPKQRVYHPWHPSPPSAKRATAYEQERFIQRRAVNWEWLAYDGLDASRNRPYAGGVQAGTRWPAVITERGTYQATTEPAGLATGRGLQVLKRQLLDRGPVRGMMYAVGRLLMRLGG